MEWWDGGMMVEDGVKLSNQLSVIAADWRRSVQVTPGLAGC